MKPNAPASASALPGHFGVQEGRQPLPLPFPPPLPLPGFVGDDVLGLGDGAGATEVVEHVDENVHVTPDGRLVDDVSPQVRA